MLTKQTWRLFFIVLTASLACLLSTTHVILAVDDAAANEQAAAGADAVNVEQDEPTLTGTSTDSDLANGPQSSDDADLSFVFTRPVITGKPYEMPIGKEVHFLVGFKNKGQKDFTIKTMDASFRYALDFSYHLQNFTAFPYNRLVEPQQEATLAYTFFVSEAYAARPYGFTVNLLYSDKDNVQYQSAVFNETVTLVEIDDGLDGETFFLYILLAAFVCLIGVGLNQLYNSFVNKGGRRQSSKPRIEQEKTKQTSDVDYDWLPPAMVANLKKTSTASVRKAAPN